jgi:excisionase family DNA binding protein
MPDEVLNTREAAGLVCLSEQSLQRKARTGEVHARKVGGRWQFRRDDLDYWIANGGAEHMRYEAAVDQGLYEATVEAMAAHEEYVPIEEVLREFGR